MEAAYIRVMVTGTPVGLVLTTFLDDLTGTGGRIHRQVAIGGTAIYDGLVPGYDVQVGIEDLETHACVGLDSSGAEFTPTPVQLQTTLQGGKDNSPLAEFHVKCATGLLDFTIRGYPFGDDLISFTATVSGTPGESATIGLNGLHRFGRFDTGPVNFSFRDLAAHDCRVLSASHPYTASGGQVTGTLAFSGDTRLEFLLVCRTAPIDVVVSGLPAGDSAGIFIDARADAVPEVLDTYADTQTVRVHNGTTRVTALPADGVRVEPGLVVGSDGITYHAAVQQVAAPGRQVTTVMVNYAPLAPCLNQPLAWYALNGTARDSSGNGLHGTIQGALAIPDRHGAAAAALSFDGIDDSIELGDVFNTLALPFSVAAWVHQPAAARGEFRAIFVTDDEPGRYASIWFQVNQSGSPGINYGDGGPAGVASRRSYNGIGSIPTDEWVHIAATVRGPTDMSLYVNGALVPGGYSGTGGPLVHSAAPARIGNMTLVADNRPWLGGLDELRVYNCSLAAGEVAALYTQH